MKTALVLGGGGPIGIAWEAGLLMGLQDGGVDLTQVDCIIGTSAGSIVGAHLALLGSVAELYHSQATPLDDTIKPPKMAPLIAAFAKAKLFSRSVAAERRSLGKSARAADVPGEQAWLQAIAGFLPHVNGAPVTRWPEQTLLLTAVDTESGELVCWSRASGIALPVAVAASCAVPCVYPLVHIGERRYMDGGMGSPTNAALSGGHDLVVIADPLARLMGKQSPMRKEKIELEKQGARVVAIQFDNAAQRLVGINLMDMNKRGRIAELARAQGSIVAEQLLSSGMSKAPSAATL